MDTCSGVRWLMSSPDESLSPDEAAWLSSELELVDFPLPFRLVRLFFFFFLASALLALLWLEELLRLRLLFFLRLPCPARERPSPPSTPSGGSPAAVPALNV
jgi:hypothetical protein